VTDATGTTDLVDGTFDGTFDGVVMQGTGGIWQVRTDDGALFDVSLRGRLKHEAHGSLKLAVGDRVTIGRVADSDSWAIDRIHARRRKLARRAPAGARGERIIVANLDQVLVVFAAARPEPHPRMLDRFLVIAEANGLAARIIINKIDAGNTNFWSARNRSENDPNGLGILERQRVKMWLNHAYEQIDSMGV
jgi:putative ribosome biogenesis GTPase RsgA